MQETSLHTALKDLFTQEGDRQEVPVDDYLIDVVSGELLIEIQTRNFTALKPKLYELLQHHLVKVVHPIALEKWIIRLPEEGDQPLSRRKSPRRGRIENLFYELVRIPHLVRHPNFSLEIVLTREEELRRNDGRGSWRRKGWSIIDRRLLDVTQRVVLRGPSDFRGFIPPTLEQPFTLRELAQGLQINLTLASKIIYCLRAIDLLERTGKRGRAYLYSLTEIEP